MENLINQINQPDDLQNLSEKELEMLCSEIREKIIQTVAHNGGHLASNLGVVELTVACTGCSMRRRTRSSGMWAIRPYTHKILTGRREQDRHHPHARRPLRVSQPGGKPV